MEAIIIHPESTQQLKAVKAALKALNIPYEKQEELPQHVIQSIKKGIEQYQNGQSSSVEEFTKNHFLK